MTRSAGTGQWPGSRDPTAQGAAAASAQDVYRSVVMSLRFVLDSACFLSRALAERIAERMSQQRPPLPPRPLADDELLSQHLEALPPITVSQEQCLLEVLARRDDVPPAHIERLADAVSGALADALAATFELKADHAHYLAACAREEAVMRAIEQAPLERVETYVEELYRRGILTGERILSFARRGDSPLFYAGLGHCAGMTGEMVEAFLADGGDRALARLLARTDFVVPLQEAIRAAYVNAATSQAES